MTFNLLIQKPYIFPFEKHIDTITSYYNLDDSIRNHWINVFHEAENKTFDEYCSTNAGEYYQYAQSYPLINSIYYYHFCITNIINRNKHEKPQIIQTELFSQNVNYNPDATDHSSKNIIFICNFNSDKYNKIVIDGNHSLNTSILKHKKCVKYILADIRFDDFAFTTDALMYYLHEGCYNPQVGEQFRNNYDFAYNYFDNVKSLFL